MNHCPRTRCQVATCTGGVCGLAPDPTAVGVSCDDGDACTTDDVCQADGTCAGTPKVCDDGLACTDNACVDGACVATLRSGTCAIDGTCITAGTRRPGEPCQVCDPNQSTATWSNAALGTACDDDTLCNGREACDGRGTCQAGIAVTCAPPQPCQEAGICNSTTGLCDYAPKKDTVCRSAPDQCHEDAVCDGTNPDCPDNPAKPDGISCDDGNACTFNDTCQGGVCTGSQRICIGSDPCNIAICDPAIGCATTPAPQGTSCADFFRCDGSEVCDGKGNCVDGPPLDCGPCNVCDQGANRCQPDPTQDGTA
jgi:hypothetical protein